MEFLLVWDWLNEDDITITEQRVDFFATKEQLFEAKKNAETKYKHQILNGNLILSPAIGYSWADVDLLF